MNKNLYSIEFIHYSPKDSEQGIKCLLLAENDEQVFNFIDEMYQYNTWSEYETDESFKDENKFDIYDDDDLNIIGTETFKERMIRLKGQMNDEDYELQDLYYGVTLYGWKLLKENIKTDYSELIKLNIIKTI